MADALHSHQSQQDGNEARSGAASVSTSASILSAGELLPAVADETSAMFLQPPTISFTPATPSPPLPTPHEGLDDSVIQGLLSGGVNSLNSPPLGKAVLIDPPDPLSLPGVSEGLLKADSGGNAELSDVSESSLDTLSSIVNSTSLSFREISAVAECLEQPGEVPSSSASVTDSQNQQEASSKDVEKSPTVPPTDSLGKEVDGTSEPVRDLTSVNEEVEKALEPSLETIPPKELDASDWKHSFGSSGEGTNCSNGDVQDLKTNDEGHSLLPTEEPAIGTEGLELGAKEPPSPLSEFSAEFAAESQQENCLGSGSSNSEIALPLEMQNSSEDSYSLLNSTITDSSKGALTNPPSECKDVSGTDDVGKSNYLCDGDAANLSSITGNESLLSQIQDSSGRPEAMEVDEENVVQKFDELEKALEVMADMPDSSEVPSSKENSLPDFADLKDGVNKTGGDDGKEVGIVKKVSSLLLNDTEEPLQPVTIGGSLQPLEEVQEASILNDPSFTADLSLIESSADEADSIGGLVINSVIGAADGVADFPPDDEMETERQLMDISSSAPRVNHGVCEVDASEDIEPSAKRRKLENGEKEDDVLVDARSVTFKVLPVKNGHGLWDSIKLKEILLSKGTLHLRIHASSNDLETFEPEKCEIEVDFTCIMVSALEEECDSALGNSTQDPEVFDPLAIGATIGAVESNSPPHYPRPFGAQTRGRSTALQPAMPRPPYRQLQSPPHAYNKNEVLGLAQGIEFEETPGTTEWSGAEIRRVTSRLRAGPRRPPSTAQPPQMEENRNLEDPGERSVKKERIGDTGGGGEEEEEEVKVKVEVEVEVEVKEESEEVGRKVCEHCGLECSELQYPFHVRLHKPWMDCSLCSFTTKATDRFKAHEETHKKGRLSVRCKFCRGQYSSEDSLKEHYRRSHGLVRDRDSPDVFSSEQLCASHQDEVRYDPAMSRKCSSPGGSKRSDHLPQLCRKESGSKFLVKNHVAEHLEVRSSDISDESLGVPRDFPKEDQNDFPKVDQNVFPKEDQNVFPAFVDVEEESNQQLEGGPDTLDVRTDDLFPEVSKTPFVSVTKIGIVIIIDPSVPCSPEGAKSVIGNNKGVSETEPSVSSKGSLGDRANLLQSWTTCIFCAKKFPNIKELILHCKNVHKKEVMETSKRISEYQRQHVPVEPCSPKGKSNKPLETLENPRSLEKFTSLNPRVILENLDPKLLKQNPRSLEKYTSLNPRVIMENLDPKLLKQLDPLSDEPVASVGKTEDRVTKFKAEFTCSMCPKVFSTQRALSKHKEKHRKEESMKFFVCPECGIAKSSRRRLYKHLRVGHRDKLRCRYRCLLLFGSAEEVSEHHGKFHEMATSSACMYCGLDCHDTATLQNHLKNCTKRPQKKPPRICKICGDIFKISRDYKFHVKKCTLSSGSEECTGGANSRNDSSLACMGSH